MTLVSVEQAYKTISGNPCSVVEGHSEAVAGIEVGGVAVTLLDTAGLRSASDAVERIGVARSHAAAAAADVVVLVFDAQVPQARSCAVHRKLQGDTDPLLIRRLLALNRIMCMQMPYGQEPVWVYAGRPCASAPSADLLLGACCALHCSADKAYSLFAWQSVCDSASGAHLSAGDHMLTIESWLAGGMDCRRCPGGRGPLGPGTSCPAPRAHCGGRGRRRPASPQRHRRC